MQEFITVISRQELKRYIKIWAIWDNSGIINSFFLFNNQAGYTYRGQRYIFNISEMEKTNIEKMLESFLNEGAQYEI